MLLFFVRRHFLTVAIGGASHNSHSGAKVSILFLGNWVERVGHFRLCSSSGEIFLQRTHIRVFLRDQARFRPTESASSARSLAGRNYLRLARSNCHDQTWTNSVSIRSSDDRWDLPLPCICEMCPCISLTLSIVLLSFFQWIVHTKIFLVYLHWPWQRLLLCFLWKHSLV